MSIEAMKQSVVYFEHMVRTLKLRDESEPAQLLFKLRQAIAEAEKQEPVGWDCCANCGRPEHEHTDGRCPKPFTTVWHAWDYDFPPDIHPQPKREWVGLTVMEAVELDIATNHPREFAAAIEAKLKEKNT